LEQELGEAIAQVEREFPSLRWLLRSVDDGEDRERIGGAYFAHIYSPNINWGECESYQGTGETPAAALEQAVHAARRLRAA
jgi:hypothetical protein